jgi:folate-binding protein YgfZ
MRAYDTFQPLRAAARGSRQVRVMAEQGVVSDGTVRFDALPAEFDAMQRGAVQARLDEFGVIEVSGADAVAFLQSQLTNDIAALGADAAQLGGYCTAKGRLLAVFTAWREHDTVYLQLPREILPAVLKRLSMFVLRAKAKVRDASTDWRCSALFGAGSAAAVHELYGISALSPWRAATVGEARLVRLPDAPRAGARYLRLARTASAEPARAAEVSAAAWWWTQVDAAIPDVFAATQEAFVPQMINLEVLGGVSFRKGCYPGQEVVARSQYLGKLRRRMNAAHVAAQPQIGADIVDGDGTAVGKIVLAAAAPGGGTDLLFECPVDRLAGVLQAADGAARLTVRALPYELHDVTA